MLVEDDLLVPQFGVEEGSDWWVAGVLQLPIFQEGKVGERVPTATMQVVLIDLLCCWLGIGGIQECWYITQHIERSVGVNCGPIKAVEWYGLE